MTVDDLMLRVPVPLPIEVPTGQPQKRRRRGPKPRYGTTYAGPGIDPTPTTPVVVPAEVGAAIRALVLPKGYLNSSAPIEVCSCQYGLCGACERGRCDRCLSLQLGGPRVVPETHVVTRRWFVAGARGVPGQVWRAGTPCRYLCPCQCPKTAPVAPEPTAVEVAEQMGLFDLADP